MIFVETKFFTRWVCAEMEDDDYRLFQNRLEANPAAGAVIKEGGGIRKIRISLPGRGKRGGARVIYYYARSQERIALLYAYNKNVEGELTRDQIRFLRKIVEEEYP
ncbi:MAG: type II toxin-antitoxin system RelE/ParE family toxin [Planctomycetota bacterium]|nr:type II toxin-antitoxin system RelE/ParE family toxin [Planctomycetota bacterium]